jgi:hypothetical protein
MKPKRLWCVRHHGGWCAVMDNKKPTEEGGNVPTLCHHYVMLNLGIERRWPDCPDCLQKIAIIYGKEITDKVSPPPD